MKKITAFLMVVILLAFVSCDTVTHYTMKVSVDRNPSIVIENRTGYPVTVTVPVRASIANGANTFLQPEEPRGLISVTYMIGQIPFTEQVTMNNADVTVTLTKRPPTLTVVNQTGYPVVVTAPQSSHIAVNDKIPILVEAGKSYTVAYRINQASYTEQVTIRNEDATVNLTKRPPKVTIRNSTGNTINLVQIRTPSSGGWIGPNILNLQLDKDGMLVQAGAGVQSTERRGSVTTGDSFTFWLGNIDLEGTVFDIRLDDVRDNSYVKRNVQITGDMTLNFTQSDK